MSVRFCLLTQSSSRFSSELGYQDDTVTEQNCQGYRGPSVEAGKSSKWRARRRVSFPSPGDLSEENTIYRTIQIPLSAGWASCTPANNHRREVERQEEGEERGWTRERRERTWYSANLSSPLSFFPKTILPLQALFSEYVPSFILQDQRKEPGQLSLPSYGLVLVLLLRLFFPLTRNRLVLE